MRALFVALCAAVASCSVLIDVDSQQCVSDADCTARGPKIQGATCVQNVCVPQCVSDADCTDRGPKIAGATCQQHLCVAPTDPLLCPVQTPSTNATVKYTFTITYAMAPAMPKPFTVRACNRLDVMCASPVAGPTQSDSGVPVVLSLPRGFAGYLQVENPSALSGLMFMGRAVQQDTVGWTLTIPDEDTVTGLGLATHQTVDRNLGSIILVARDCDYNPLAGVTVQNRTGGVSFYIVNGFPTPEAQETTNAGSAGFVNVPVGSTIVTARHNASGHQLSDASVVLRAGWISYVEIFP